MLGFRLPDPFRRVGVPADLDAATTVGQEVDPAEAGMSAAEVDRIWRAAVALYRTGTHPALQLCLRRHGQVVLNRSIGHAHGNGPGEPAGAERVLATPDTPFCIFSASKAITATVVHLLDERGLLHIGDRVADHLPDFAAHGKDRITVAHVLAHRAGLPSLPPGGVDQALDQDWAALAASLTAARPVSRAGKNLAYHATSGGFILGELVRQVTGKSIDEVLQQEILGPLGFRWTNYGVAEADLGLVGRNYPTGMPAVPPLSLLLDRAFGMSADEVTALSNDPRFLATVMPAANVVSTAAELSRFFELLRRGGELDGVRVLQPRTVRRATTEHSYRTVDLTLGAPLRHGLGFMLGADLLSVFGPDTEHAFGHLGFTNILGWADPERALSAALITSGKPTVDRHLPALWNLTRRISQGVPAVETR